MVLPPHRRKLLGAWCPVLLGLFLAGFRLPWDNFSSAGSSENRTPKSSDFQLSWDPCHSDGAYPEPRVLSCWAISFGRAGYRGQTAECQVLRELDFRSCTCRPPGGDGSARWPSWAGTRLLPGFEGFGHQECHLTWDPDRHLHGYEWQHYWDEWLTEPELLLQLQQPSRSFFWARDPNRWGEKPFTPKKKAGPSNGSGCHRRDAGRGSPCRVLPRIGRTFWASAGHPEFWGRVSYWSGTHYPLSNKDAQAISDQEQDRRSTEGHGQSAVEGAIESVLRSPSLGFFSRLFLVPKKTGDLHPVIDLSTGIW